MQALVRSLSHSSFPGWETNSPLSLASSSYFYPSSYLRKFMIFTISMMIIIFWVCVCRFVTMLPSGWPFLLSATFLRMAEGVGSALASTSALALIPVLHPKRINTIMVSCNRMLCMTLWNLAFAESLLLFVG